MLRTGLPGILLLLIITLVSCQQNLEGSNANYIDNRLRVITDSISIRGSLSRAEQNFLDSIVPGATGVGINQLAHKYIVQATASPNDNIRMDFADSALNLLENRFSAVEKSALLFSRAANIKGSIYFRARHYDEAIRNFTLLKIALIHIKDSCERIPYYDNMARILYAQRKTLEAVPYFKKVIELTEKCRPLHSFTIIQEHLDNIALCYIGRKPDSAYYYFDAALDFIDNNKDKYDLIPEVYERIPLMKAVIYANKAELYFIQNKYHQAAELLNKSLEITRGVDQPFTVGSLSTLFTILVNTNQLEKAGKVLHELETEIDTSNLNTFLAKFYRTRSTYYEKKGMQYASHKDLATAYEVRDAISRRERQFSSIDVAREFENKEQKNINDALKKENELQQSYALILGISTALALIIAGLIWHLLRRKSHYVGHLKKLNNEIESKNVDLQHTLESLERSHKENTRLIRVVAHDLRNPVGAIRTLAYSLKRKDMPQDMAEALDLIQATCTDSLNIIKDLLDTKQENNKNKLETIEVANLMQYCRQVLQLKAEEKNQNIIVDAGNLSIKANREKLYRVLSNLVNNAIKFSPEGAEIKLASEKVDDAVIISVQDRGIGIPEHLHDKILTMSPEISRKGTAGEESYGLGLSICKNIIQEHNGSLWFDSEEGKGSTFYIQLPAA